MITVSHERVKGLIDSRIGDSMVGYSVDATYVLPDLEWLGTKFTHALAKFISVLRLHEWIADRNDCDNFAAAGVFFAGLLHARTPEAPEAGIAIGKWYYTRAVDGRKHGINFAVTKKAISGTRGSASLPGDEGNGWHAWELDLVFIEPQLPTRMVTLTEAEIESCERWEM